MITGNDLGLSDFKPLPLTRSGWVQTILGRYWPQLPELKPQHQYEIDLGDGDQLLVFENRPQKWSPSSRIIVMIHGLAGCYQSSYMKRLTRKFLRQGYRVVRVNLRTCGPGFGLAKRPYHSGRSDDARKVLMHLEMQYPKAPVTLIGFSLGANIVLKMVGEDQEHRTGQIDSAVAVSPPADLAASAARLSEKQNRLFDQYFVKAVKAHVVRLHDRFPELDQVDFPVGMSLTDFDDVYTAPFSGFSNAQDYYQQCSSAPLLGEIRLPCLLLSSLDDPVVDSRYLQSLKAHSYLDVLITKYGGHVAFLGWTGKSFRWMDEAVIKWVELTHLKFIALHDEKYRK